MKDLSFARQILGMEYGGIRLLERCVYLSKDNCRM